MKMGDISQIGANIRFYREKRGLTQRTLADNVLVSFQAISAWERGLTVPDLENVVRLAGYFGITVDALLTGAEHDLYVGIEGSGSKTEFVLFEKDGTVRNVVRLPGANPNDRGLDASLEILCRGMEQLLAGRTPKAVFAGIAGAPTGDLRQAITTQLQERFHTKAEVDGDAANVLSCAQDPEDACAIICSTGSCVFVQKNEKRYRLGGWGYLLDQAGSAYDVGKDAVRCALGAEDGLQPHSLLTERIAQALGGNPYDGIPTIYKKGRPYIAALADIVVETALEGDVCALEILRSNAKRLADIIRSAITRYGMPGEFVASGKFIKNDLFREMVEQQAQIRLTLPDVTPVYGACVGCLRSQKVPICSQFHENFMKSYHRMSC